jgi:pimeloyl-ACP methyl ester carboxylesterase
MVHELGGAGLCGWLPYGSYLAAHGMHVLLYDTRCSGASRCPHDDRSGDIVSDVAGAKAELMRRGARSVAVPGASYGGAIALASAVAVQGMTACVVLSGDLWSQDLGGTTGEQAARRLAVPVFYAVATQDGDRLATARQIVARVKPSLVTLRCSAAPLTAGTCSRIRRPDASRRWLPRCWRSFSLTCAETWRDLGLVAE